MCAQAFTYFDKDNDAQLTVREMKDSVTAVFKERKNMAHSLKVGPGGYAPLQLNCRRSRHALHRCYGGTSSSPWHGILFPVPAFRTAV
jgi:hypothetical protein